MFNGMRTLKQMNKEGYLINLYKIYHDLRHMPSGAFSNRLRKKIDIYLTSKSNESELLFPL